MNSITSSNSVTLRSPCYVSACPDVITRDLTGSHEFIAMACDGIWDVMSNQEVLQFIRARIAQRMEPTVVSRV